MKKLKSVNHDSRISSRPSPHGKQGVRPTAKHASSLPNGRKEQAQLITFFSSSGVVGVAAARDFT